MPTNEEHRNAAAMLRIYEHLLESFRESPIVEYPDWEDVCNRLSELIEPERTCKMEECELTKCDKSLFVCSECNAYMRILDNYCPGCGAKIAKISSNA